MCYHIYGAGSVNTALLISLQVFVYCKLLTAVCFIEILV